jgi:hypothetical protein
MLNQQLRLLKEIRTKAPSWLENKRNRVEQLVEYIINADSKKPEKGHDLYPAYVAYASPSNKNHRQYIIDLVKKHHPDWLLTLRDRVEKYIREEKIPPKQGHPLHSGYSSYVYLNQSGPISLRPLVLSLHPEWLRSVDRTKQMILQFAKDGSNRKDDPKINMAFMRYCWNPKSKTYDAALSAEIHNLRPEWFETRNIEKLKTSLLSLAKQGRDRPKSGKLGAGVVRLHKSDPAFIDELIRINPKWKFRSATTQEELNELLKLFKEGLLNKSQLIRHHYQRRKNEWYRAETEAILATRPKSKSAEEMLELFKVSTFENGSKLSERHYTLRKKNSAYKRETDQISKARNKTITPEAMIELFRKGPFVTNTYEHNRHIRLRAKNEAYRKATDEIYNQRNSTKSAEELLEEYKLGNFVVGSYEYNRHHSMRSRTSGSFNKWYREQSEIIRINRVSSSPKQASA